MFVASPAYMVAMHALFEPSTSFNPAELSTELSEFLIQPAELFKE